MVVLQVILCIYDKIALIISITRPVQRNWPAQLELDQYGNVQKIIFVVRIKTFIVIYTLWMYPQDMFLVHYLLKYPFMWL